MGNLPSGYSWYTPLLGNVQDPSANLTNVLEVDIDVGSTPNTAGWLLQKANGSLTPILQLSTGGHYIALGPPAWYSDYTTISLTDDQLQSFLSGQLYVQADFGSDIYQGQLLPFAVPEPTPFIMSLLALGYSLSQESDRFKKPERLKDSFLVGFAALMLNFVLRFKRTVGAEIHVN